MSVPVCVCHQLCSALVCLQSPAVTTQSSSRTEQLAKRLKDAGAKMYGAFWCSHCHEQKEAFGSQAMKDFPYVECYPDGFRKVRPGPCLQGSVRCHMIAMLGVVHDKTVMHAQGLSRCCTPIFNLRELGFLSVLMRSTFHGDTRMLGVCSDLMTGLW